MSDSLNILYVLPRFYPFKGGAESHFLELGKRLVEKGHTVNVLTSDFPFKESTLEAEEIFEGIKITRLRSYFFRPMYLWFAPKLLPKIWNDDFDVIHVSGFGFIWVEICLLLRRLKGKYTAFNTPHGPFMAFQNDTDGVRGISKYLYDRILGKILPFLYTKVFAVVPNQKEWIRNIYKFKEVNIEVIENGISESYLEEEIPTYTKKDPVIITYTGRMEWYKGIQDVIEAISILVSRNKKLSAFEFHVMGRPDKFTEKLQSLIEKREVADYVKLIFAPSDEERDSEYLKSQIFILPSKWEATGIVLLEAMAKGNVLISTKQNEAHSIIIKEDENGYSYNFGDIEELVKILKKLITDFDLRQKMIKNNFAFSREFTWERIFPNYLKIITETKNE